MEKDKTKKDWEIQIGDRIHVQCKAKQDDATNEKMEIFNGCWLLVVDNSRHKGFFRCDFDSLGDHPMDDSFTEIIADIHRWVWGVAQVDIIKRSGVVVHSDRPIPSYQQKNGELPFL